MAVWVYGRDSHHYQSINRAMGISRRLLLLPASICLSMNAVIQHILIHQIPKKMSNSVFTQPHSMAFTAINRWAMVNCNGHLIFQNSCWWCHRASLPGGHWWTFWIPTLFRGIMTFSWKIKPSFWCSTKDFSRLIKRENAKSFNNISSLFVCTCYLSFKNYVQTCIISH